MTRSFRLHPDARRELEAAAVWYDDAISEVGNTLLLAVDSAIDKLVEFPALGPPHPGFEPTLEIRRYLLRQFPFAIVYIPLEQLIDVFAIAHTSRKPLYWQERLADDIP